MIWFNPPYSKNVELISKCKLINKHSLMIPKTKSD